MEQIKVVPDCHNDEIKCPRCQSISCIKRGKFKDKQKYYCKDCHRKFTDFLLENIKSKYALPENISPKDMKSFDVWDLRVLGKQPTTKGCYGINFSNVEPKWLKQAYKDFIWLKLINNSTSTVSIYLSNLKFISKFASQNNIDLEPQNIDRNFVLDLLNHLAYLGKGNRTICQHLTTWEYFFDFCRENELISKSHQKLIYKDDYPKRKKSQVKDIPEYVLKQLDSKVHLLAKPIALIVKILLETGMRIDEVCQLQLNCLEQDSDGDWWINCYRRKVNKETRLFISKELALNIQQQQNLIQNSFQIDFDNLFCTTEKSGWFREYSSKQPKQCITKEINYFIPVAKSIHQNTVRGYLHQLAYEHNITDISGEIYPIWRCHRFRHTHLTDLARKGTGIAHIMQRAGHASPQMAIQYIHLTDDDQKKKMKEVWNNTHFNMEGEIVAPVNPDLDTAEMQWIKKGMGMQTTDNGYCTLLWTQTCPHQDLPCKGCGNWVTTLDFLDSHKKELEETEKIIENARQKGYQRQIEKNVPRAERLRKIISGMEKHQTMRGLGHNEWEEKE